MITERYMLIIITLFMTILTMVYIETKSIKTQLNVIDVEINECRALK